LKVCGLFPDAQYLPMAVVQVYMYEADLN
jgi:hypothetical protein